MIKNEITAEQARTFNESNFKNLCEKALEEAFTAIRNKLLEPVGKSNTIYMTRGTWAIPDNKVQNYCVKYLENNGFVVIPKQTFVEISW